MSNRLTNLNPKIKGGDIRMEEKERNAIAYALLKVVVKREFRFQGISELKRKAGNLEKETDIPKEKIIEVVKQILIEVFEKEIKAA